MDNIQGNQPLPPNAGLFTTGEGTTVFLNVEVQKASLPPHSLTGGLTQ